MLKVKRAHAHAHTHIHNACINIHLYIWLPIFVYLKLCEAVIPIEGVEPKVSVYHERVEFVGSSKSNNISILLWNITFEDEGEYICFAKNPKEKNRNHSAIFTLFVVDQSMWHTHSHTVYLAQKKTLTYYHVLVPLAN